MEIGGRACAGEGVVLCLPNLTLAKSPYRPQVGLCSGFFFFFKGFTILFFKFYFFLSESASGGGSGGDIVLTAMSPMWGLNS